MMRPFRSNSRATSKPNETVSLMRGDSQTSYKAPSLGFAILPKEMAKGYAKEAAATVLAWAGRERGVVAVVLRLFDPANEGSKGALRSLDFQYHGVHELVESGGVIGVVRISPRAELKDLSVFEV